MDLKPTGPEKKLLDQIWQSQKPSAALPCDFTQKHWPSEWARKKPIDATPQSFEAKLLEILKWPEWVRVYAKPSLAVVALSKHLRSMGKPGGVVWMAPGAGKHFDPPSRAPGLAVLRTDWASDASSVQDTVSEARARGLVLLVDESTTGFRLAPEGACQAFDLNPDMVFFGSSLAGGLDFAAVAGKGKPPLRAVKQPSQKTLAVAEAILTRAARPETATDLADLGRIFIIGLNYFIARVGLNDEVSWEGPPALPRLSGKRLWAFFELAKDEGLNLSPLVLLDAGLNIKDAPLAIWPRLARALARLKSLPQGEKAPLGWTDAAANTRCQRVDDILNSIKNTD
jgi:hypothetical protein